MKCHQILTGAANRGDRTFGVGSVEGIQFTAYAAGCNIVILSSSFERVQIVPGVCLENVQINCVDCAQDTGKIAAAYENTVIVLEPTPLLANKDGSEGAKPAHGLDYWWVETARLECECFITTLAFNSDGSRLLTAGDVIQLWSHESEASATAPGEGITFEVGGGNDDYAASGHEEQSAYWNCLWKKRPANAIAYLAFSPDGMLFATAGLNDRLVRVWYQNNLTFTLGNEADSASSSSRAPDSISFSYIYLAHPRSVTGFSFRKTSKYMPRNSVANMMVTSCVDNVCRLWCETLLPEDSTGSFIAPSDSSGATDSREKMKRQKDRFIQRFKHMRQSFAARKVARMAPSQPDPIVTLPSTYSAHELHKLGYPSGPALVPGLHFHLAATINALTDIPLVPAMSMGKAGGTEATPNQHNFVLHWLNNKEMQFTLQAESIMEDLFRAALRREDSGNFELELGQSHAATTTATSHLDAGVTEAPAKGGSPAVPKRPPPPVRGIVAASIARPASSAGTAAGTSLPQNLSSASLAQSEMSHTGSAGPAGHYTASVSDMLDHRIDMILKEWHQNSDLLFSVHPVDGSLLVWVADFLDEYLPGSFRQAQVSFSSRIPNVLPLGDAMSMGKHVALFNAQSVLNLKELFRAASAAMPAEHAEATEAKAKKRRDSESEDDEDEADNEKEEKKAEKKHAAHSPQEKLAHRYKPSPVMSMISKHSNGTLNLWNVMFAEKSKFAQLLNIRHISRVSGHRFRVNDIRGHPVLPLLLTTSHHNAAQEEHHAAPQKGPFQEGNLQESFRSELILWRIDPVGPLSKSGGISELARINSSAVSAFCDVAWIPTLLPSTTLGNVCNSPSACFVASDGQSLRVYQAVIDARTLLAEINSSKKSNIMNSSLMSISSGHSSNVQQLGGELLHEKFKIVSTQSTARPGAILELDAIVEATQDWKGTLMLHAIQEQLITVQANQSPKNQGPGLITAKMSAIVDLQQQTEGFKETFYVIVAEVAKAGVLMHMWKLVLASSNADQNPDDASSGSATPDVETMNRNFFGQEASEVRMDSEKVCTQKLPLPEGVTVIHAVPAVGQLSSSSIYPACLAPYVMLTACSDNKIRFWRVNKTFSETGASFEWEEWPMESTHESSSIEVAGRPVSISAAFSGRIACAYQTGHSFQRPQQDPNARYVNLCVAIYECESTGGSEWILEDTISLKNIELRPELPAMDMSVYEHESHVSKKHESIRGLAQRLQDAHHISEGDEVTKNMKGLVSVPSLSTFEGVKRYINKMGTSASVCPKQSVILDWVSNEDGSHILTVAVGNKVLLLTAVSSDISQATMKAFNEARSGPAANRPVLRQASSLGLTQSHDDIRWMQIKRIALRTADGLNPTPMSVSWVRDGILMCGMDNEIAVYSQWRAEAEAAAHTAAGKDIVDYRNLDEADILNFANDTQLRTQGSFTNLPSMAAAKHIVDAEKRKRGMATNDSTSEAEIMPDIGLFEAAHIACPVLPQYHPKQLMELLNSGKIRWVKAILGHLVRCIGSGERQRSKSGCSTGSDGRDGRGSPKQWTRSRALSISYPSGAGGPLSPGDGAQQGTIPEELTLDYTEITSIPPLPLWTLLAASKEVHAAGNAEETGAGYDALFSTVSIHEDNLDLLLDEDLDDFDSSKRHKPSGGDKQGLSYFGPRQARILSKLLTHAHLPGLTSLDQMQLLAVADTVASCNLDLADRFAIDAAKRQIAKETSTAGPSADASPESLDDCGLRFLLAMKHFTYLQRCLPLVQRAQLQRHGLKTSDLIWGFHSESEEELLAMIPSVAKGNPNWNELRELGVGWWVRNNTTLKRLVEKLAKTAFQTNQDPLDAAVYYLAMKKKSLVCSLYKSIRDEKMSQFFANNFSEDRWRKAAMKNAFALLGKQRFVHAVAFFLLCGSLNDAINICIDKLEDIQMAMIISRLYEGDNNPTPISLKKVLYLHVLGRDTEGENEDLEKADPDPFLRSMSLWILKEYSQSLSTLVEPNVGFLHPKSQKDDPVSMAKPKVEVDPTVFNFYIYLRTHPLIARHQLAGGSTSASAAVKLGGFRNKTGVGGFSEEGVTPLERRLYFSTAHFHLRCGCPALAIEVLSKLPTRIIETKPVEVHGSKSASMSKQHSVSSEEDAPKATPVEEKASASDFDWSQPVAPKNDDELNLEWSDNEDKDDEDLEAGEKEDSFGVMGTTNTDKNVDHATDKPEPTGVLDIMAQQLKFIACLKIMMEELSTLATGFEVDGGLLRYQLYIWLEREVEALRQLCNYGATDVKLSDEDTMEAEGNFQTTMRELYRAKGRRPTLHEVMMAEKVDFEAKVRSTVRRKQWLKANQTLLRTLMSYCGLHGASASGLASVRMELCLLLQELQQEKSQKQLLSPLPFPTTLPLLSACIAQHKMVVADPIRHLQSMTHDMLTTIVGQKHSPLPGQANYSAIFLLRDLSVALSSCVYQSLCDSDSVNMKKLAAREGPARAMLEALSRLSLAYQDSSLITTATRKLSYDERTEISTEPSKWPGVTSLRALLDREKDDEAPNLVVLLCETYVAIYMSLLCYALASCDAQILYRLVAQKITPNYWSHIFGGGAKKVINVDTSHGHTPLSHQPSNELSGTSETSETAETPGLLNAVTSITKQRVKLNIKVLGMTLGSSQDSSQGAQTQNNPPDKQSFREHFMPPDMSIVSKLMTKPYLSGKDTDFDLDSNAESDDDDFADDESIDDDPFTTAPPKPAENKEHSNPNSFSWCLMRYACICLAQNVLEKFIAVAGIELPALRRTHSPVHVDLHKGERLRRQETSEELPVASPLIYSCLRITESWLDGILDMLNAFGKPPDQYIPGCSINSMASGPAIEKYKCLFEPQNHPFPAHGHGLAPIRRLWMYLVRQTPVQRLFIKYIFSRRPPAVAGHLAMAPASRGLVESQSFVSRMSDVDAADGYATVAASAQATADGAHHHAARLQQPVKIIHKEHEAITAFCINKVSTGLMTIATQKELQELNISLLLNPTSWHEGMNEEADFDVLNLHEHPDAIPASNYLVIQTPGDAVLGGASGSASASQLSSPTSTQPPPFGPAGAAPQNAGGKGATVSFLELEGGFSNPFDKKMKGQHFPGSQNPQFCRLVAQRSRHLLVPVRRHKIEGIRRLASHSHLPLYVSGGQDGSIRMWEWSHSNPVQNVRPPGVFAKVNRVRFTSQGNKFGASDGDGNVALWQASTAAQPYFNVQCHSKQTSDFVFQGGCSSLFLTAGHSSDGRNVGMWDTLMPQKRCLVQSFVCHENGASAILYAAQRVQMITAGKKGLVAVWDVRQQKQLHVFKAHEQAIKCLAIDPNEEFFVSGTIAGDIKVWSLSNYRCLFSFPTEHARQGIFKNISQGVSQLYVDGQGRLFSCGADGSIKIRKLPDREWVVNSMY